jgi:hypothetical protein
LSLVAGVVVVASRLTLPVLVVVLEAFVREQVFRLPLALPTQLLWVLVVQGRLTQLL